MRKILSVFVLVAMTSMVAFAARPDGSREEDRDDHNDKGPIQAGYAVVTPTSASSTGLVAFETFGLRGRGGDGGALQAGVLPPGLTTSAVLFVDSSGRLSKNLGVAIVNPNSSDLTITMTLRKNDGTQLATSSVVVPSHQQVSRFVTELFSSQSSVPSDFTGMLSIVSAGASPQPVSVIGLRFRGPNFSTLPITSLSSITTGLPTIATGVGGNGAILLPQFAAGGGWATEIVLANTGTTSLTVRVDLFKPDGTALTTSLNGQSASSFTNLTIPAGGVVILAPRDNDGDDDF